MAQLTMADITELTLRHMCSDPVALAGTLSAAAIYGDGEDVKSILEMCKSYGIDPLPAIKEALKPSPFEIMFRRK